ncbi:Na(+)-translocating NADH-quinone reductase subunit C [hydrothermal vent metagenome]|uniref:Na(+)-translocating NADH-quinone reductase subunit C n=1 Tax=hydrothermal vent metagenome TaxID=652676 RepID=A0A3B1B4J4_9ZZZZ
MQVDHSNRRAFTVAFVVCVVCAALVTTAAVLLRPIQQANRLLDRQLNVLAVAGLLEPGKSVDELSKQLDPRLVDIASGKFVELENLEHFDERRAARNPAQSIALTPKQDIAQIKRRANYARVYLVWDQAGNLKTVVLPVHGYGLWSQLYGFLALESDGNTVAGLSFYEHAETPGLGGKVDDPAWKALWPGKQVYDEEHRPAIRLVKGPASARSKDARYQVDALSGATLTTRGIEDLLRFWLGPDGFGPFLAKIRDDEEGKPNVL